MKTEKFKSDPRRSYHPVWDKERKDEGIYDDLGGYSEVVRNNADMVLMYARDFGTAMETGDSAKILKSLDNLKREISNFQSRFHGDML